MLQAVEGTEANSDYDKDALEKLEQHFEFFFQSTSKILEVGSSSNSAIPKKYKSVTRLSLSDNAFSNFESTKLTADKSLPFESSSFDYVVMSSGVEGLDDPRDLFREVWRVLRPEGRSLICFQSKPSASVTRPVKMWTTMTDEQKIWIAGRYGGKYSLSMYLLLYMKNDRIYFYVASVIINILPVMVFSTLKGMIYLTHLKV